RLHEFPLLAEATHGEGAAQRRAGLDRELRRHLERQLVAPGPALQVDDAIGDLGLGLVHQHVVMVAEYVTEVERVRHDPRAVPGRHRLDQMQAEVAVGPAEAPVNLDRLHRPAATLQNIAAASRTVMTVCAIPAGHKSQPTCWPAAPIDSNRIAASA